MKDKYSQGSQEFRDLPDFLENYGEDPSDNLDADFDNSSHDSLVAFLKQNKAIAPPPSPNFEQQLFAEISKYPQRSPQALKSANSRLPHWWLWALLLPAAIATSMTFNWATNRSQLQMANNPSLSPMSEAEQIAIEQTLISSWNVTDDAVAETISQTNSQLNSRPSNSTTPTTDVQLLSELSPLDYE